MTIFETEIMNPTFIFVDGSYFCFYRYYALLQWWKNAYPDEIMIDPYQNQVFVDKFKKTFIENLKQIPKKLKLDKDINPIMIAAKDCKRENIWRMELFNRYKANRTNGKEDGFMGGPFFKMVYDEDLFQQGNIKAILHHPKLEADDCIAISVKYILDKYPQCNIYIITSDRDYLQLQSSNVHIFNLAYKNLKSSGDSERDLAIKILMGDDSDNIPSVFPKCGEKTAIKCLEDDNYFKKKMNNNSEYYKQYELNQKLVNFNNIPKDLQDEFIQKCIKI
jgi:5'-3' exonuclease